jgi:cytosine/adenosine deaminase-related metal-dependent hydrolase
MFGQDVDPPAAPLIIGNGIVTDGVHEFVENGAVRIQGDRIESVGKTYEMDRRGVTFVDVGGRLILPGFLNAHHHLYSTLATGLSPLGPTDTFVQILDSLWWRLDLALDEETTYYSALLGIVQSIKHGVTTIFDHHASMGRVRGSLAVVAKAFHEAGIRGVLCFETSERTGADAVDAQIEENLDCREDRTGLTRRAFGLHANFTLSDQTLERISRAKPSSLPIHIHCGEDRADLDYCQACGYQGPVDRLHHFGLLSSQSLLAHAVHLSNRDYRLIEEIRPIVICNPESNANNRVGTMDHHRVTSYILGTDGMSPDMVETLRSHYLLAGTIPFSELSAAFFERRYAVQQRFFPDTGSLRAGTRADLVVLDYVPVTPIHLENLAAHLVFGARGGKT